MIDEKKLLDDLIYCKGLGRKSLEAVIEVIKNQPQADKWIPCEERLPIIEEEPSEDEHNVGKRFLITDSEGYVYESTFWKGENDFEHYAIAWMPKPQPYKKEGAENE